MELDEMKQAWQILNKRFEHQQGFNLQMFRDDRAGKARRRLIPLRWGQGLQIAAGVVLMFLAASFWIDHLAEPHLCAEGLLLHAYGLMLVLTAARNLYLQDRVDFAAPVIDIQKRLAVLRQWRLREALLYGVTGCFVWIPLVLVLFALLGADVWAEAPLVVASFLAGGMACLGLMYGLIRWSLRPGHARLRRALLDSCIGRSVLDTQAMLDEIARFERT